MCCFECIEHLISYRMSAVQLQVYKSASSHHECRQFYGASGYLTYYTEPTKQDERPIQGIIWSLQWQIQQATISDRLSFFMVTILAQYNFAKWRNMAS